MSVHHFEYSRTSRATCSAAPPCGGSIIPVGTLRYGRVAVTETGSRVEWRHWGCVTPAILAEIARIDLDAMHGFDVLKSEDQAKIRLAIKLLRVDSSDIPDSARPAVDRKRKAMDGHPSSSKLLASTDTKFMPSASQMAKEEDADEDAVQEDEPVDELYCTLNTNVVGIQYYQGMVGAGERVILVREPTNRYDSNAIQVKNISYAQVGHLPRQVAQKLAPLLDRRLVNAEGTMLEGNLSGHKYTLSMSIQIYARPNLRPQLEPMLIWATPGQRGFPKRTAATTPAPGSGDVSMKVPGQHAGSSSSQAAARTAAQTADQQEANRKLQESFEKAAELKQILNNLEKVDDDGRRESLLDQLLSTDDVLSLPLHPNPPGIESGELTVNLLKHQSQGLQWCIERENPALPTAVSDKPVQFWQLRKQGNKAYYYNLATKTPQATPPELGRGALCADGMGLGKTLTMIALIIATKKDPSPGFSKTTLIVVPLSILSNWEKQIDDHCTPNTLSYCIYYGAGRSIDAAELQEYDVVITTYQTVVQEDPNAPKPANQSKKKKMDNSLFQVKWKRVILDEGHQIRNPKTKMAQSVSSLVAERRMILSGTPIINSPKDLGSMLTFLKICRPLDDNELFKSLVLRPLAANNPSGAELLRGIMSHICIRRTKEMQDADGNHLVPLPPVDMTLVPVALSPAARELYDAIEEISSRRVMGLLDANGGAGLQAGALSMLTRLRQLALHPGLIPKNYLQQLEAAEENADKPHIELTPVEKIRLQGVLAQAIQDLEECPICFNALGENPRITTCAHWFCLSCILDAIQRDPRCPMDRREIGVADLLEPPPPTDLTQAPVHQDDEDEDDEMNDLRTGSSDKIDQLIHLLQLTPPADKSLVFSQFTSFLDKIGEGLERAGIPFARFDGKMSAKRREETIRKFSKPIIEEDAEAALAVAPKRTRGHRSTASGDAGDDDDGSDFVMDDVIDDDDDFLDEDEDVSIWTRKAKKGKGNDKAKPKRDPLDYGYDFENPRVMLISLKAGALGLNLTVANNVYLMDPWWQEGIESQAIDRCNRIGQKKPVHVYQLISENTVEAKVIEIQEKKKALIKAAFSGIKNKETQREKRQARLQEIIELFGIRDRTTNAA